MRVKLREESDVAVQMAPLIDCVFLLLIFFLVTAALKKIHNELPVYMPDLGAASVAKPPVDKLTVFVTTDGHFLIGEEPITSTGLNRRLRDIAAAAPQTRIVIRANRRTAFQYMVHVLNECQFYNLRNVNVRLYENY